MLTFMAALSPTRTHRHPKGRRAPERDTWHPAAPHRPKRRSQSHHMSRDGDMSRTITT
jgi:hypothetical protein